MYKPEDGKQSPSFIVVTPAFNEEKYIHYPIDSMIKQTVKPIKWIIVDDDSSDRTTQIIKNVAEEYDWIEGLYIKKKPGQTYYSSNVYAILEGIRHVESFSYDYLAILDADIELCYDYYERIFEKFNKYKDLGIATGTYLEKEGDKWEEARIDRMSTPKAIQVFNRKCYESTDGYIPFRYGGEDTGMEIMARMNNWKTWSFRDIIVKHHRPVGTGDGRSLLKARYRLGITAYCLGTQPYFILFKSIKRMFGEKPFLLSGIARFVGYLSGYFKSHERQLPDEAIEYFRKEQFRRLTSSFPENWNLE